MNKSNIMYCECRCGVYDKTSRTCPWCQKPNKMEFEQLRGYEIKTSIYLQEWLIGHMIECENENCLCTASTPQDALVYLYEKTGSDDIAEALKLSKGKIDEVKQQLESNEN